MVILYDFMHRWLMVSEDFLGFPIHGVPLVIIHFCAGIFHEINHPAIGVPHF
jgi:hypothetical protein